MVLYFLLVLANDTKDSTRNSSYSFANFPTTCRYWNEHTDAWDTSGCEVNVTLNHSIDCLLIQRVRLFIN